MQNALLKLRHQVTQRAIPSVAALAAAAILVIALPGCRARQSAASPAPPPPPGASGRAVIAAGATSAEDGQWTMAAKDYASSRYSGLAQITTANAKDLKLAWTFSTGTLTGNEAAPLVVGDTLYVVTPYPNVLYALDLKQPGAPAKWSYKPKPAAAAQGVACCDVVNRGAAYADGKIFFNTLDDHTVAVDAATGRMVWTVQLGDIQRGETMTMAPIVVKGRVLVGNSGGEMGVRGWLTALDAATGKTVWRAYSTGPDRDVLIGPAFHPFYPQERGTDLGIKSWPGEAWKIGGGTVWGWVSYDPALDLVYYGTSNPGPWNAEQRPGDNKWTTTIFARDPESGAAHWAYQTNPHDLFDYDDVNENVLVDMPVPPGQTGQVRRVILHPDRNGYLYTMDRTTGQVLSAKPFVHVTTTHGIDLRTGRPIEEESKRPGIGRVVREICPAAPGGKDWQPSAFSPRTGYLYLPHNNLCQDEEGVQASYIEGTPFVGANVKIYPGPGGNRGAFTAWDPVAGRAAWSLPESFPAWSGALATAGDVVFYGTMEGWFKAVDAHSGKLLWKFKAGSGIIGQPISYRGPDGKQYVAVLSGVGGWAGAIVSGNLDPRDGTAALGFVNAMGDLPQKTTRGGMLYVFALP